MKPNRPPKRQKPFVPRWTAHVEAKKRDAERAPKPSPAPEEPYENPFHRVLPPGGVLADITKQKRGWGEDPVYYYKDIPFSCRWCGKPEIWTARQQKWWYEVAERGCLGQTAIACRACRKQRRAEGEENTRRTWMVRFATLQRLAPEAARLARRVPENRLAKTPLAELSCSAESSEKLAMVGIVTVQDLLARSVTGPIEGVTLHDLQLFLRALKRKLKAAQKGCLWDLA